MFACKNWSKVITMMRVVRISRISRVHACYAHIPHIYIACTLCALLLRNLWTRIWIHSSVCNATKWEAVTADNCVTANTLSTSKTFFSCSNTTEQQCKAINAAQLRLDYRYLCHDSMLVFSYVCIRAANNHMIQSNDWVLCCNSSQPRLCEIFVFFIMLTLWPGTRAAILYATAATKLSTSC